ncbi:MAG: glutamyl-tRNA reductase [candidate division Zixibacteria bacterium]|nr:glutamyl-tRNA reductase [candidate division Zixibacteria bacterium]
MISFGVIGSSIRGGNISLLSALTIPEGDRPQRLQELKEACGFSELVAVFTCNRVEFYYIADGDEPATGRRNKLLDFFLRDNPQVSFEPSDIYCHSAFRALKHLYRVAGSLDSMMVGEAQVLGQVKKAFSDAREMGLCANQMESVFTEAFRVAKKIRRETPLGEHTVSMVSLVVGEVECHLYGRDHSIIALVGVGPMTEKLAAHFKARDDVELIIVNRSTDRGAALAEKFNAKAMSITDFVNHAPAVDVVFSATAAPHTILGQQEVQALLANRDSDLPLLLIDLAIPHDIDATVAEMRNVVYRDIPRFRQTADKNRRERFKAVDQAERIVDIEVGRAHRQNAERQFRPVFASALNEAMAYAHAGLDRLFDSKLQDLDDSERKNLTHFVEKLVRYTNNLPVSALAEQADTSHGSCAMIAGYGCVQTRAETNIDTEDPSANRCARHEGRSCVLDGKHTFML